MLCAERRSNKYQFYSPGLEHSIYRTETSTLTITPQMRLKIVNKWTDNGMTKREGTEKNQHSPQNIMQRNLRIGHHELRLEKMV